MNAPSVAQLERIAEIGRRTLSGIGGVEVIRAETRRTMARASATGHHAHPRILKGAHLLVHGWSASLHGVVQLVTIRDVNAPEEDIERFATSQRSRRKEGIRHGSHHPFALRDVRLPEGDGPLTEIGHLKCDRAGLQMLLDRHGDDTWAVADELRDAVRHANGGLRHLHALKGTVISPSVRIGSMEMTGCMLVLPQELPQSVLMHVAGRRLGEVASIIPALDNRRIVTAETPDGDSGHTWFRLASDNVRVGNILVL